MNFDDFKRKHSRLLFVVTWMLGGTILSFLLGWATRGIRWAWHHFVH